MGHHLEKFFRSRGEYPNDERLRLFIRRNRKKILAFLAVGAIVFALLFFLAVYLAIKFLGRAPQVISENRGPVSQFVNWALNMVKQLAFLFGG